jgi:hypothetical protein
MPAPPAPKRGKEIKTPAPPAPKKGKEVKYAPPSDEETPEEMEGASDLPVLQISDPGNPAFQIMQSLSAEVNNCKSSEDIGKAFLRAKEALTGTIKFHPALFDLIKVGNDYIRKKPKIDPKLIKDVQDTVESVYKKLGGS